MMQSIMQPIMRPIVRAVLGASRGGRYNGPSLALRFGENQYLMGEIGKKPSAYAFDQLITFTRSTTGWEWDWRGNYRAVAAGLPRIAHDPLTKATSTTPQTLGTGSYTFDVAYQYAIGAAVRVSADASNWMVGLVTAATANSVTIWVSAPPVGAGTYSSWTLIVRRGIRVEEQRTNLLLNSVLAGGTAGIVGAGAVAPTGWSFSGPTPNGEITYAATPFGTLGVRFQATAQRPAFGRSVTALANTLYSYHARITALVGSVEIQNAVWAVGFPVDAVRTFWRNGVTVAGNTIVAAGDHVAVIVTMGATAGTFVARFGAGAQTNATCDVTMTMPQVEAGFPSSYIPTEGSQVIRAADVPLVNTLAPWFNAAKGALVVSGIKDAGVSALCNAVSLDDGTGNNRIQLRHTGTTGSSGIVLVGGVTQAGSFVSPAGSWPIGESRKAALSYEENAFAFSCGGIAPLTDNAGAVPTVSRMVIGSAPGYSSAFNGILENITYHPRVNDVQQAAA